MTKPKSEKLPQNKKQVKLPVPASPKIAVRTIDATGKILGRLSTEVAIILRGKNKPSFRPNLVMGDKVLIINAAKIKVTGSKMTDKLYRHHTGYMGHLKTETLGEIFRKSPAEVIRRAVTGMLPKNKLRKIWLKNLEIRKGE